MISFVHSVCLLVLVRVKDSVSCSATNMARATRKVVLVSCTSRYLLQKVTCVGRDGFCKLAVERERRSRRRRDHAESSQSQEALVFSENRPFALQDQDEKCSPKLKNGKIVQKF